MSAAAALEARSDRKKHRTHKHRQQSKESIPSVLQHQPDQPKTTRSTTNLKSDENEPKTAHIPSPAAAPKATSAQAMMMVDPETTNFFAQGEGATLVPFLDTGDFSDCRVRLISAPAKEGEKGAKEWTKEFSLHKMVLAQTSTFFAKKFKENPSATCFDVDVGAIVRKAAASSGTSMQSVQSIVFSNDVSQSQQLSKDACEVEADRFAVVLRFCYGDAVPLTAANALPLLRTAEYFEVKTLCSSVAQFLGDRIKWQEAILLITQAQELQMSAMVDRCLYAIAKHFCFLYNADFSFMSYDLFLRLLTHSVLNVSDEKQLYECVCEYVTKTPHAISVEAQAALFDTLRLRWLSFADLSQIAQNSLVPRYLIIEALLARVQVHEIGSVCPWAAPDSTEVVRGIAPQPIARLQKRARFGISVEYIEGTAEDCGILHWISTQGNRTPWQHPGTRGVNVTASSVERGNMMDVVRSRNEKKEFWTKDVPSSWVCVDVGEARSVIPTHYSLVHGGNYVADMIRTWHFQGSSDGENWVVLRSHSNDSSLNAKFARQTWIIDSIPQLLHTTSPNQPGFRYFRILQHGHNSSKRNFLLLGGVELYGELFDWSE